MPLAKRTDLTIHIATEIYLGASSPSVLNHFILYLTCCLGRCLTSKSYSWKYLLLPNQQKWVRSQLKLSSCRPKFYILVLLLSKGNVIIYPLTRPIVGVRAWRLPRRSFSIWDNREQHRIIPVVLDPVHSRMLSRYIFCGLPHFLPPLTVPCSISLASVLCLVV